MNCDEHSVVTTFLKSNEGNECHELEIILQYNPPGIFQNCKKKQQDKVQIFDRLILVVTLVQLVQFQFFSFVRFHP